MYRKSLVFFTIFGIILTGSPALAFSAVERKSLISAVLDAMECRLDDTQGEPSHEPDKSVVFSLPEQTKATSFFSDFTFRSPISDLLTLTRGQFSPIMSFNQSEDLIPDLPLERDVVFEEFFNLPEPDEQAVRFYLGSHYGYFSGYTVYQIGFNGGKSELQFPLQSVSVMGPKLTVVLPQLRLWMENAGYFGSNDDSGEMYDSDWGANDALISDTVSDAFLKRFLIWDSSIGYALWDGVVGSYEKDWNVAVSFLGGYRDEYFKYMIYDVRDATETLTAFVGPVLEYRVRYTLPYLGLKLNLAQTEATWGLSTKVCFSPFAHAEDFDDHLLRGKRAIAEGNGWAAMVGASLFYHFNDNLTLQGGVDYANIRTFGEQVQHWYLNEGATPAGTTVSGIDTDIFSNQVYFWGRFNYKF